MAMVSLIEQYGYHFLETKAPIFDNADHDRVLDDR
jgi:hypothetical protein